MIRINSVLLQEIIDEDKKQFTVKQLRDVYQKSNTKVTNKNAGQMVHRTLRRLVAKEMLTKENCDGQLIYSKSEHFDTKLLRAEEVRGVRVKTVTQQHTKATTSYETQIYTLRQTLNQYQVDLLSSIGEAEEFKRLCESFPEAKSKLYPYYMNARNCSSALTGRIKALEACIEELRSAS
ncbi:hypothetical protein F9L16_21840 [Agarivorans sp. B2Z047]|uniref:hypothetical protein n=1 Tax=Agarivorans sp. B2Z047 TaxID=2652721 RepID=UPI00128C1CD0|nr:hypothetical protein [Agarivorans sp. B2Z047]MPW31621.1 hypothetical protein [Agarivorans sp. B2Z047]UQN42419.1 hypothetical protein LQZ07_21990 [Agarivorans sp. B2Z047]